MNSIDPVSPYTAYTAPLPEHESYELISSTRYDRFLSTLEWNSDNAGPNSFLLLQYHFDRLRYAAERHGWLDAQRTLTYGTVKSVCESALEVAGNQKSSALKVRMTLSKSGVLKASTSTVPSFTSDPSSPSFFNPLSDNPTLFSPVLTVYIDYRPTPSSIFTSTKTTKRELYNDARLRVGLSLSPESFSSYDVLLFNSDYAITETSIFNVALYRSSQWLTPSASTGCLPGVFRRWLLEEGRIHEDQAGILTKESVKDGDWVLLFNGAQGCRLGRIARVPAQAIQDSM